MIDFLFFDDLSCSSMCNIINMQHFQYIKLIFNSNYLKQRMGLYKVLFSDKDLSSSCDSLQVKAG